MMLPPRVLRFLLMTTVLAACAGPDPSTAPSTAAPVPPASVPETAAASREPSTTEVAAPSPSATAPDPDDPPALALEVAGDGFAEPIGLEPGPDGTLLVQERAGRLVGLEPADGTAWTVLDLRDRVLGENERGLLGAALHPEWPDDPRLFVHYSDRAGNTVLARFRSADPAAARPTFDPGDELVLLRVEQPFANHNGGQLVFGPDGYLWLGLGDGGSGGDPFGHGQDPGTLLGSILRLDVGAPDATEYAIPPDNPFAAGGGAPEVVHHGLRNPWRFSFSSGGDELFIADVGQNAYEEINRIGAGDLGRNFGWNLTEGGHCFADPSCDPAPYLPWAEYGRDLGCSVTGGFAADGRGVPALAGWYLFSDYCSGLLFGVALDELGAGAAPHAPVILLETGANVTSFGRDASGNLYLADIATGTVSRIVAAD